jgi:replicative DNA helicase
MSQLKEDFLIELAKACLVSGEVMDVVTPHLQYTYLPNEPYKHIFKYLLDYHHAHKKAPTIGMLAQNVTQKDTLPIIGRIREVNVYDSKNEIIETFETFIRNSRFFDLHAEVKELFNKGEQEKAIVTLAEKSKDINEFSLKVEMLPRVFADYDKHERERREKDYSTSKIPTGIPQFDYHTRGGPDRGTGILGIARSGVGKTTFLRSLGMNASFRGINVLHLAAGDSTLNEIRDGYTSWWTGVDLHSIREGRMDGADHKKIDRAKQEWLANCGEIYMHAFKQFNQASILDCRNILIDLLKERDIGLVLFDYLEKFKPGDGRRYGTNDEGQRVEKMAIAEKIINIATEFNVVVGTVTQASNIDREKWNNPKFVISREHISNLKATVDPFAYCVTLNQTEDENDNEIMRIHEEKLRHYKIFSHSSTYHVAQKRDVGRFIDVARTKELFWDDAKKQIIRNIPKA